MSAAVTRKPGHQPACVHHELPNDADLRALAEGEFAARVAGWERAGHVPDDVGEHLAATGVLGALVPARHGGTAWTHQRYGEANRLLGTLSSSLQSLLTVHGMVTHALARWGSAEARSRLGELTAGRELAAFALSESVSASDVRSLTSWAERGPSGWRLTGTKRWICFGQLADVFLVFAMTESGDAAFVVRRDDPGVRIIPEAATAGFRAARLAVLELDRCAVGAERLVGRPGFGLTQVAGRALTLGRLWVAFGSVGLAQSCVRATLARADRAGAAGRRLKDFQLLRGLISDTHVAVRGAHLLAVSAASALDAASEWAVGEVLAAKLAASRAASLAASVSAQVHGAEGLLADGAVHRRLGDARVMEVIEGNTQLVQDLLAEQVIARWRAAPEGADR